MSLQSKWSPRPPCSKLLLAFRPAPVLKLAFKDQDHFQLGSPSYLLNANAIGYQKIPHQPEEAPDPSMCNMELPEWTKYTNGEKKKKPLYSDSEGLLY